MLNVVKVYGPYSRKQDRRKIVVLRLADGKLTTKSYARFLYEQEHGEIDPALTVDHIDENETNDTLENFQLLTRVDNIKKSVKRGHAMGKFVCPMCDIEFEKELRFVTGNQTKQGKSGPFCSRSCAGRFSQMVQMQK